MAERLVNRTWFIMLMMIFVVVGGIAFGALIPDRWDHATVISICRDGTPILRQTDGTVWARRNGWLAYRVEDEKSVCGQ